MQSVVIAKRYEFVPPDRRGFWTAVFRPFLRPVLAKVWGVSTVEISGLESLRSETRAALVVYPMHHGEAGKRAAAPTMGLTLVFPENDIPRRIGFAVRRPEAGDEPIVDAIGDERTR